LAEQTKPLSKQAFLDLAAQLGLPGDEARMDELYAEVNILLLTSCCFVPRPSTTSTLPASSQAPSIPSLTWPVSGSRQRNERRVGGTHHRRACASPARPRAVAGRGRGGVGTPHGGDGAEPQRIHHADRRSGLGSSTRGGGRDPGRQLSWSAPWHPFRDQGPVLDQGRAHHLGLAGGPRLRPSRRRRRRAAPAGCGCVFRRQVQHVWVGLLDHRREW